MLKLLRHKVGLECTLLHFILLLLCPLLLSVFLLSFASKNCCLIEVVTNGSGLIHTRDNFLLLLSLFSLLSWIKLFSKALLKLPTISWSHALLIDSILCMKLGSALLCYPSAFRVDLWCEVAIAVEEGRINVSINDSSRLLNEVFMHSWCRHKQWILLISESIESVCKSWSFGYRSNWSRLLVISIKIEWLCIALVSRTILGFLDCLPHCI